MDNIGQYKKVIDLHWNVCGFRIMYIVDTFSYIAVDEGTGDIVDTNKDVDTLEKVIVLDHSNGPGYTGYGE